jgi:rubredoxin
MPPKEYSVKGIILPGFSGLSQSDRSAQKPTRPSPNDSRCGYNFCYFLDLRGEASLRMRAMAKPIITSTPRITSANLTGGDYLRVQRTSDPQAGTTIVLPCGTMTASPEHGPVVLIYGCSECNWIYRALTPEEAAQISLIAQFNFEQHDCSGHDCSDNQSPPPHKKPT